MTILQRLFAVLLLGLALVAVGCGDDDGGDAGGSATSPTETTAPAAAPLSVEIPEEIRSRGTLRVATDATYPPNEFVDEDGSTIVGMDVDLIKAIGERLGLEVEVQNAGFDAILPGLTADRYDVGISSFTATKERQETVDFVTYFRAGTSFFTLAEGGSEIDGLADLCGLRVAVQRGTTQADDANAQDEKCREAGEDGVDVQTFPDQNAANLALNSDRADLSMADSPVADYQVQQSEGRFVAVGTPYGTAPYGVALPKGSELPAAVKAALDAMKEDGTYMEILEKWGVEAGSIDEFVINGAED